MAEATVNDDLVKIMVKEHGNVVIDAAYECPALGFIWLVNTKKKVGFARLYEPEWGPIDVAEIKAMGSGMRGAFPIFKQHLPCKFSDLVLNKAPQVQTYFKSN